MATPQTNHRSPLDRFLGIFADVHAGEGVTALLLALNVFLILMAYYILKPVREALILGQGSAELKTYMSAGQVIVLAFVVPMYGRLVASRPRMQLINTVTAFFTACLVLFYFLAQAGMPLAIPFFIWIGVFSLMIVAQFWSFANVIYDKSEGERLFAIVGFGASLGAVFGARIADRLIEPVGVNELLLLGAAVLGSQVLLTNYVDRREREHQLARKKTLSASKTEGAKHGESFKLVFKTRYLLYMAIMLMLANWVNTTGEYILSNIVKQHANDLIAAGQAGGLNEGQIIGDFYSKYFTVCERAQPFTAIVPRVADRQILRHRLGGDDSAVHLARRLQRPGVHSDAEVCARGEGPRELDRLLAQQHRPQHAVPAVHVRGEVQRQAGD